MIIPNGKASFIVVVEAGGIDAKGDPIPDQTQHAAPVDCNIVTKSKTSTAGDPAASFTRSAYEILTEIVPESACGVVLHDTHGILLDECEIQYTERLEYVDAFKTIAYAKQR